jgi:hypothetical protein
VVVKVLKNEFRTRNKVQAGMEIDNRNVYWFRGDAGPKRLIVNKTANVRIM